LDLAVAMARSPADVPPGLVDELRRDLDEGQLVELASAIAWENYRARFNRVFGVRPAGFMAEGAFCVLPERTGQ
jgi:alkylhydroperoxidase family enzyme